LLKNAKVMRLKSAKIKTPVILSDSEETYRLDAGMPAIKFK